MNQARMKALVKEALNLTVKEMVSIDLSEADSESEVDCCDTDKVAGVFTKHLCTLLYPKNK